MLSLALVSWLLTSGPAVQLESGIDHWKRGHDIEARSLLERASRDTTADAVTRALIHLYLGLTFRETADDEARAVTEFRAAMALDPLVVLPAGVSPRVKQWWIKAGGSLSLTRKNTPAADAPEASRLAPVKQPERAGELPVGHPASAPSVSSKRFRAVWFIPISLGVAAALSAATGAVLGISAANQARSAQSDTVWIADATGRHAQAVKNAQAANIALSVGGALAVGAGVAMAIVF